MKRTINIVTPLLFCLGAATISLNAYAMMTEHHDDETIFDKDTSTLLELPYADDVFPLLELPPELIVMIVMPKTKKYNDIIQSLPIADNLMRVNSVLYTLLTSEVKNLKKILDESNAYDEEGMTPLISAILNNRGINEINNLINNGANLELHHQYWLFKKTPLYAALRQKNYEIAELLLDHGAKDSNYSCLTLAIFSNDIDMMKFVLKYLSYNDMPIDDFRKLCFDISKPTTMLELLDHTSFSSEHRAIAQDRMQRLSN